jgi:hypothetical protein
VLLDGIVLGFSMGPEDTLAPLIKGGKYSKHVDKENGTAKAIKAKPTNAQSIEIERLGDRAYVTLQIHPEDGYIESVEEAMEDLFNAGLFDDD